MKSINFVSRTFRAGLLAAVILSAAVAAVFAQTQTQSPLPAPTGFVNDYAGVIDAPTKSALEKRLQQVRDGTSPSIEIAVVTVRTTGEQDIFDYSLAVARGWGIGSKTDDNPSLLLLVAIDDRKYFTQTSRDAEGDLPDGLVGQLQRQNLVPAFKQGQYGKGIQDTVEAYIRRFGEVRGFDPKTLQKSEGQPAAPPVGGKTGAGKSNSLACLVCLGVIALIVFIFIMAGRAAGGGRDSSWNGGSFGGAGGNRGSVAGTILPMIIGGLISSLLSGGRGGGWGGGGSSGGGGSDGGWGGGFGGGGDFGGGGAGGSW